MKSVISARIKNNINIFLNRYFNAIAFAAAVVIFVLGYLFLIAPKYKQIVYNIESAGEEEGVKYSERQKYLNQLKKLKTEYQTMDQADIEKIEKMLPSKKYHEELLPQLEEIILKNGFLLTSLQVEADGIQQENTENQTKSKNTGNKNLTEPAIKNKISKIKIKMNIVGADYKGFKRLLGVIENNLRLMDITNLSFDPSGDMISLEMYAYYLE